MEQDISQTPTTADEWKHWAFLHAFEHTRIADRMADAGQVFPHYPLRGEGPIVQTPDWLMDHDAEHGSIRERLGIGFSVDYTDVDTHDPKALADWIAAHYLEHILIDAGLPG